MTPDERKQQGPAINGVKDRVTAAITAAKMHSLPPRLMRLTRNGGRHLPVRETPAEIGRVHPISQVTDG